jgi:hypothetical protein
MNGLKTQLSGARLEYNKQGGADLESLTAQIQTAEGVRDDREAARSRLALMAEVLNPILDTRADFDRLHEEAAAFLEEQATGKLPRKRRATARYVGSSSSRTASASSRTSCGRGQPQGPHP